MAVTIVETRAITGGVDTHADTHVAAALDPVGGLLGVREFPVTAAGYAGLLGWLGGFGTVCLVGIEGTGSYGAGLSRHVTAAGVRVVEAGRSDRQDRNSHAIDTARRYGVTIDQSLGQIEYAEYALAHQMLSGATVSRILSITCAPVYCCRVSQFVGG